MGPKGPMGSARAPGRESVGSEMTRKFRPGSSSLLRLAVLVSFAALAACGAASDDSNDADHRPVAGDVVYGVSSDGFPTTTKPMAFEACLRAVATMSDETGMTPINIAESRVARIVRFNTRDGSVLVMCSRPDRNMVIVVFPRRG